LVEDPLSTKGANSIAEAVTNVDNKVVTLGDQKQNEVEEQKPQEQQQPGGQPMTSAKGGVQSTMAGFSRGVSVDGTLTVLNFGMLTN